MVAVSSMPAMEIDGDDIAALHSTQTTASVKPEKLASRASEYILQKKFNQSLTLPATETHGALSVTYAVGGLDSPGAPTMLFIGGMLGGRFLASIVDHIATQHAMRIVAVDR